MASHATDSAAVPAEATKEHAPAAAGAAAADGGEDDVDLFGSDDEEEDPEAVRIREQRLAEYKERKAAKPKAAAKSIVTIDVKPWDDETNMEELEALVRGIEQDGLVWGQSQLVDIGYGIKKLQISAVVEDDKVSTQDLQDEIEGFEDHVQSSDIANFQKL